MDGKLWKRLYRIVMELSDSKRGRRQQFSDREIVLWFVWAVLNDRPTYWACQSNRVPRQLLGRRRPSPATMSRRLRCAGVLILLQRVERNLTRPLERHLCKYIDAKPLPVGHCSKDRDARFGRRTKGYRLYVIMDKNHGIYAWQVQPNNCSEVRVAEQLLSKLDGAGYVIGDGEYDANQLYDLAWRHEHQLVAPRARPYRGFGHKRQAAARLRSCAILEKEPWLDNGFGRGLVQDRTEIERFFGHLTSFHGGLAPLPAWVRTLPRVTRWVQVKLIINAVRARSKKNLRQ